MAYQYSEISGVLSQIDGAFKQVYADAVDSIPESTPLTAQFKKTKKVEMGPQGVRFYARLKEASKVANVSGGRLLPSPATSDGVQGSTNFVNTYASIVLDGVKLATTKDRKGSFLSEMEEKMESALEAVRLDVERQYNGDGRGVLCTLQAVVSAPTYGAQAPFGVTGAGPGTMLLVEGMDVAITSNLGVERGRATINSIDTVNNTFTLSASVAGAIIGDFLVRCNDINATGGDLATNFGVEANGILAAVNNTGTFEGIDSAAWSRWRSTVITAAGTPDLTPILQDELNATIRAKSGRQPSNTLNYTSPGVIIRLKAGQAGLVQYTGESKTLNAGFEAVVINGKSILEGSMCPKGHFFTLDTSDDSVGMIDFAGLGMIDADGAKLARLEQRHLYGASVWLPHQAVWFGRNRHGVLKGLADISTITRTA